MAYDDPKLPWAVLRDENLYVGDDKQPYFREPDYVIDLQVTDLKIVGGFEPADPSEQKGPKEAAKSSLRGTARLERKDKFAVAGLDVDKNTRIRFHLTTTTDTRFLWAVRIGFEMYDWEWDREAGFWVQGYCTSAEFGKITAAVRTGHVEHLRVSLSTNMWTKQKSNGFMPGVRMIFYLAPPTDRESRSPNSESGFIHSITWDESYGVRTPTQTDEEVSSKISVVEAAPKIYPILTVIVAIGAFIAAIVLLWR